MSPALTFQVPPSAEDDGAYVFIDHREEETSIVGYVSERLEEQDALEIEEDEQHLSVRHRGKRHRIPLQLSPHDRYIMIASLAHILRENYQFFLLKPSLDGDTHGLLVVHQTCVRGWTGVPDHLAPLDLGYDYFSGIRIPYLDHEDSAPSFALDRERIEDEMDASAAFMQAMFSGKMDPDTAAHIAKLAMKNPELLSAAEGKSETEIAEELQSAFKEAFDSPEVQESQREIAKALADLKVTTSAPQKPWWKLW